jgi:hypothetical protein
MKKTAGIFIKISFLLPYLFIFISTLYQPWDADLGWHLKYGEYFFKTGEVLKTNIHSTEMAGYYWPNTGWLNDVATYAIYNWGGFLGLTLASAAVLTLTFFFFGKAYNLDFYSKAIIFPLILILEKPLNEMSYRGQQVSIMLLGILMFLLLRTGIKKQLILIPLLFALWINVHGQFILGLAVLFLYTGAKIFSSLLDEYPDLNFEKFKGIIIEYKLYLAVCALALAATLINPFGIDIYKTALSHFQNEDLKRIIEYLPFDNLSEPWWNQMAFGIFAFLGLLYIFFSGEFKKQIPSITLLSILYALSWWVRRYAWSMYYLGIPLLKPVAHFLKPDSPKNAYRAAVFLFIFYLASSVYIKWPFFQFAQMNWQIYCDQYNNCSPGSIEFIRYNNLQSNLLTLYGWGGYMIWNYPEVKPSIDGRMHLWKDSSGYSAFSNYYALEQNWEDIDSSKYDAVLMWTDKPIYDRLEELTAEGKWEKAYEDQYAGVFVRTKSGTPSSEFILNP